MARNYLENLEYVKSELRIFRGDFEFDFSITNYTPGNNLARLSVVMQGSALTSAWLPHSF